MNNSNPQAITSRDNPLFKRLHKLVTTNSVARREGLAFLDGPHLVNSCLDARLEIRMLILARGAEDHPETSQLLERTSPLNPTRISASLYRELTGVVTPVGIGAVIVVPKPGPHSDMHGDILALDAVQDAGNVGTLLRTAAAVGIKRVVMGKGCAGAWSVKVLRAGQGAHFRLEIDEGIDLPGWLEKQSIPVLGADAGGEANLFDQDLKGRCLWVFGSEGKGLADAIRARLTATVRIPLAEGVESLNVAAAAAVCLFESLRQRQRCSVASAHSNVSMH